MVWLTDARAPEGLRLYAIGDIHGCLDALVAVHRAIEADLDARPASDWRVVHLGDYVDRGPRSREVLDFLSERAADPRMVFLRGNHDEMFRRGVAGDRQLAETWLKNGGVETLASYGVELLDFIEALRADRPQEDRVPEAHLSFLDRLMPSAGFGDYYFVHAGIDPRWPLDRQAEETQLWIREPFLSSGADFGAVVVHGHTPVPRVDVRPNRIGIDTGAVFGGTLTCLVLEHDAKGLLTSAGPAPLPWGREEEKPVAAAPGVFGRLLRGRLPLRFGGRG